MTERRRPGRGRGKKDGRARPGGAPGSARSRKPVFASRATDRTPASGQSGGDAHRSRLTGRALVLLMVLLVLAVSYGSSFKAYLRQRAEIADLRASIAERQAEIDALELEKKRWEDPAFVRAKARERFGYVMPGETSYVVLDEDGEPLEPQAELADPAQVGRQEPAGWWNPLWESVELAGQPQNAKAPKPPAAEIDGSAQDESAQDESAQDESAQDESAQDESGTE